MKGTTTAGSEVEEKMRGHILNDWFPCIMAQTVVKMDLVEIISYDDWGSEKTSIQLLSDLKRYISNYDFSTNDFNTLLAVFPNEGLLSEEEFEKKLWHQLQLLHRLDNQVWDKSVDKDPDSKNFSFSINGKAFYIVGMHPGSSRKARKSPFATMTFNLHWQFEKLREMGTYDTIRDKIRERDIELQGNINPMLEDFGIKSEARQYSGRAVSDEWKCPFHPKPE